MRVSHTLSLASMLALFVTALAVFSPRTVAAAETVLTFSADRLALRDIEGRFHVAYDGALSGADRPGAPDLPVMTIFIEAPCALTVGRVEVEVLETEALGVHDLAPVRPDHPTDSPPPVLPALDPAITGSPGSYPEVPASFAGRSAMRGRNLLIFSVRPVRWWPESGELELLSRLRLRYELAPAPALALERRRTVPETEARFAPALASLLSAGGAVSAAASVLPDTGGVAGPGPFQPTFRPTTDGSAVEYVIVTSEALSEEFERLADWKTEKGVQAVVRTVEWIDQTYPNGIDQAERIRFFVRDAYQNWGTLFVLLGGDTDILTPRYTYSGLLGGEMIPSDYYFGCLEGNWNADGDAHFGEAPTDVNDPGDLVDFMPEVYIGRFPVSTVEQAAVLIDKVIDYDQNPASGNGYPPSILYLAERLFTTVDGAAVAEAADAIVPPWFKRVKLYEEYQNWPGALPETYESVVDSINNGFGIVHHVGHGFRNTMAIGAEDVLTNADADALANHPRQSVVFAVNCSSASIDFNSIGERWVKNPNGGAAAYIGTSRQAFVNASAAYQENWMTAVFVDSLRSLGGASAVARLPMLSLIGFDNSYRWTVFSITLLGDPELELKTNVTSPIEVLHDGSHALGSSGFAATVLSGGSPVPGARVTLWKEGEAYVHASTGLDGQVLVDFPAENPGPATLTVHRTNYDVYRTTIDIVEASGPYLYLVTVEVDDDATPPSSGDADGLADAGETVELQVTLRNSGGAQLTGALATLTADDPGGHLAIIDDQVSYGSIAAGGASAGAGRFVVSIDPDAPYAFQPLFTVEVAGDQGSFSDVFVLPVHRSFLEHYQHEIDDSPPRGNGNGRVEAGEEIHYSLTMRNSGQQTAYGVTAGLQVLRASDLSRDPLVTVSDSTATFGTIPEGATVTGDRFAFQLAGSSNPDSLLLRVTLDSSFGPIREEMLDLVPPGEADSLVAFGSPSSVTLTWKRPTDPDVGGYDIYRSQNPGGPFARVNEFQAEGSAMYEDRGLPSLTRFYYRVVARDSSMNEGRQSVVAPATTNPPVAIGWPVELGQQAQSSLQLANTAGGSDNELFTASDYQYGWHADGTEIVDGDNDPRTSGVYAIDGYNASKGFSATCALGDLDRDGTVEVVNVGWSWNQAYVWNNAGELMPGWPQSVFDDFNWPSPILTDVDGDLDLEVVIWAAKGGRLLAFHHDGSEVADGDQNPATHGILTPRVSGASFCFSSPAAGDLDGDLLPEIVFCVNISGDNSGGIYAVNGNDGTPVPGWPVFTGDPSHPSQITASPAIGDLDRDGVNEVVVASERNGGRIHVLNADGSDFPGWPIDVPAMTAQVRTGSPVLADLDGDSFLDVIFPGSDGRLWAWQRDGTVLDGFPARFYDQGGEATQSTPTVGDLDADGQMEILLGDESGKVHAFNHDGTPVAGFPIQLTGEVRGTPIMWDIDNDGLIEVGVVGWDANVYIWDLPFEWNPTRIPWPFFRHDVGNTGYVGSDVLPIGILEPQPGVIARIAAVHPARPNPFNPRTTLAFDVPGPEGAPVKLTIFDVEGRLVTRLVDGKLGAGRHEVVWDGRGARGQEVAAGVYFYRVTIGSFSAARKLTLVK